MTELIWDGKYDKNGARVAPVRVALPFQTVETLNESAQQRQLTLRAWADRKTPEWRNRLVWGDKKYVLPGLVPEFAGKVNLVYIDPPFAVGANFEYDVKIGGEEFTKEPSIIEQKAFRDTWGKGLDSYLQWFYETALLLKELLHESGSLYVHLDSNVSHYAKCVLDEVFPGGFQREVVWRIGWISGYKSTAKNWIRNHDVLLFYVKDRDAFTFNKTYVPYPPGYHRRGEEGPPADGKGYPIEDVWNGNEFESALTGEESLDSIQIKSFSKEKTGYPTQKNESLVRRIVEASSNSGDLVLDCFVGGGTTAAVAEKLGRRWIAADLSRFAIHVTRKRLLGVADVTPFIIQNLGKYERQVWQRAQFGSDASSITSQYRKFLLDLYHATPVRSYQWLHGMKGKRLVHVGAVDSPISRSDIDEIIGEVKRSIGRGPGSPQSTGIDVLGWEFAFEINEMAKQKAEKEAVNLRFVRIPREVMDKQAVDQGDIKFFELASLAVGSRLSGRTVTVELQDFVIPPDDVPEEVRHQVRKWTEWIDYWAIDWNNKGDTFHNEWQSYRTRAEPKLKVVTSHLYDAAGEYVVEVKVVDVLGNDTTKQLPLKVR